MCLFVQCSKTFNPSEAFPPQKAFLLSMSHKMLIPEKFVSESVETQETSVGPLKISPFLSLCGNLFHDI